MEEAVVSAGNRLSTGRVFVMEIKKLSYIGAPMAVVTLSQMMSRLVSMMMIGHLGQLALSGAALATSFANVTGFSVIFGMAGALETLCGQAFGAKQYEKLGVYAYSSVICLALVCVPVSLLWIFMEKILIHIGQNASVSAEAGRYAIWLIPALFPYTILQMLTRYLQTQSLVLPMLGSSVTALIFHIPVCWILVFKVKLGIAGAALALALSYGFNVILLLVYINYSTACKKTSQAPDLELILPTIRTFFRLAVPSAIMACPEWWSAEITVLLAGLLPHPQLETSVLSICLLVAALYYYIPYSFGAAASTRISNELGAGSAEKARVVAWAATFLSITEAVIACLVIFSCRSFLGYAFTTEKEVVKYLERMTPFLCILLATDSMQAVFSGVARGSGWQHIGAYANLVAYYLVGLPVAVVLSFVVHLRGKGLLMGQNMGSIVQSVLLCVVTCSTNWMKLASLAQERLQEGGTVDRNDDDGENMT